MPERNGMKRAEIYPLGNQSSKTNFIHQRIPSKIPTMSTQTSTNLYKIITSRKRLAQSFKHLNIQTQSRLYRGTTTWLSPCTTTSTLQNAARFIKATTFFTQVWATCEQELTQWRRIESLNIQRFSNCKPMESWVRNSLRMPSPLAANHHILQFPPVMKPAASTQGFSSCQSLLRSRWSYAFQMQPLHRLRTKSGVGKRWHFQ
jgi:hypothetical protein